LATLSRPDPRPTSQTVKELVKDFKTVRQDFLREQEELVRQLKNATGQEREIIREQLKDRLQEWRDLQKQHMRELREQVREMTTTLPAINDVINAGSGEGRGR
jgi:polyhydroxyalkanoate synthesis regulator phasin